MSEFAGMDCVAKPGDYYCGIFQFDENMKKVFVEGVAYDGPIGALAIGELSRTNDKLIEALEAVLDEHDTIIGGTMLDGSVINGVRETLAQAKGSQPADILPGER